MLFRKSCSLDVKISASGYTKELLQDAELLYPAGPEGGEMLSGDDDDDDVEEVTDLEKEEHINFEEYKQAIDELDGLRIGNDIQFVEDNPQEHGENSSSEKNCNEKVADNPVGSDSDELDNEDECPDLVDISAYNKEVKPFR